MAKVSKEVIPFLRSKFDHAWKELGVIGSGDDLFTEIVDRMSEEWRHYHDLRHLAFMLKELDRYPDRVENRPALVIAVLTHDWVGKPGEHQAEVRSAQAIAQSLLWNDVAQPTVENVYGMVVVTDHSTPPTSSDERLIVDLDLSILAADPRSFDSYEEGIWREWAPLYSRADYVRGRIDFLRKKFLSGRTIFSTEHYQRQAEGRAQEHLTSLIERLSTELSS